MSKSLSTTRKRAEQGMRSTALGIGINALLAVIKVTAGFFGNSYALIADGIESASDVLSSMVVFAGLKIAIKPRDENHPYGHGKAEPLAAVLVSMALFGAAIIIAVQSAKEIITPHHAPAPYTLIVLLVVVVTKELLYRYVFSVGEEVKSTAVKTDAWHHRSDAITSMAAFLGIVIALIGGEGWEEADDWAALFASAIIIYNAYQLFKPAINEVMDAAPPIYLLQDVKNAALGVDGVLGLDKCFIRKMGFDHYVDLHVIVSGDLTVRKSHNIGHKVKNMILQSVPGITDVLVHIEPEEELEKGKKL
ncbi:MAG: cation transporter [Ignavibacteriaceae bacterium]|nr:cation transporter [Ignavibacteriaceae bacterium]